MTPEQLRLEEVSAWLDRARHDLRSAELLLAGEEFGEALFHCQQAAEKALKGFLTFHQRSFPKTHDLSELTPGCVGLDASLGALLVEADALSQYAWRFRYPGAPYEPGRAEAVEAVRYAESVVRAIEARLRRL